MATHPRGSLARPAGADDFLKWRRSIDEHLELGRLSWDEYGMFSWLCTKADPHTGRLRTSWTIIGSQTRLGAKRVEQLCRSLKGKGYIGYPEHRGSATLAEVAIDKFPLRDGTYTALARHGRATPAEARRELKGSSARKNRTSPRRVRERDRTTSLRVRSADASTGSSITGPSNDPPRPEEHLGRTEALAAAPRALRETVELFWLKTGRDGLTQDDLTALRDLDQAHTPAVIQKAITESVERFERRGDDPRGVTFRYVWDSLRRFTTRKTHTLTSPSPERPVYPPGLTRLN
jgi:hypothetical protein